MASVKVDVNAETKALMEDLDWSIIQNDIIYWYKDYFTLQDTDRDGRLSFHEDNLRLDGFNVRDSLKDCIMQNWIKPDKYYDYKSGLQVAVFKQPELKRWAFLFRGSDEDADWEYDFDLSKKWLSDDVFVHNGFHRYIHQENWFPEFCNYVKDELKIEESGWDILCTGHSLGGASATVACYLLSQKFQNTQFRCISIGAPRAGNEAFWEALQNQSNVATMIRIVDNNDPVTQVPNFPYTQGGIEVAVSKGKLKKVGPSGPYCPLCPEACMCHDVCTMLTSAYWVKCVDFPGEYHGPGSYRKACESIKDNLELAQYLQLKMGSYSQNMKSVAL